MCAFGALIKEPLLSEHPMLNVHPSLLPRWRGAAPIERAIMAGDEHTGVSIMRAHRRPRQRPGVPRGSGADRPARTPTARSPRGSSASAASCSSRALDESPPFAEQDDARGHLRREDHRRRPRLDPARPAAELERVVRALTPHIGANVELADGTLLGVREARVAAGAGDRRRGRLSARRAAVPVLGCADGRARAARRAAARASARWAGGTTCADSGGERRCHRPAAVRVRGHPAGVRAGRLRRPRASRPRPPGSTPASARSRWRSPTARSSAATRSTTWPRGSCTAGRRSGSIRHVLAALRLGLFQLLFLGGVAEHAAVERERRAGQARSRGRGFRLVNAVLRRATREGPAIAGRARRRTTAADAALRHSRAGVAGARCGGTSSGR